MLVTPLRDASGQPVSDDNGGVVMENDDGTLMSTFDAETEQFIKNQDLVGVRR